MNASKAEERGKEPEQNVEKSVKAIEPKKVVVWGGGVIVASGDEYGEKQFLAIELEQAVTCGVALRNQLIRGAGRELSKAYI